MIDQTGDHPLKRYSNNLIPLVQKHSLMGSRLALTKQKERNTVMLNRREIKKRKNERKKIKIQRKI